MNVLAVVEIYNKSLLMSISSYLNKKTENGTLTTRILTRVMIVS